MFKKIVLRIIKVYQKAVSPLLRPHCRFSPTCSEYCLLAIEKYGVARGALRSFRRVLRCNPFCAGGVDLP